MERQPREERTPMNRKLIPTLVAALLLAVGIGVSGALAGDDHPTPAPPMSCASLSPGGDENDLAKAVGNAAANVGDEAETEEADDEQGDEVQGNNDDQGEQGDCQGEDNDDQGADD